MKRIHTLDDFLNLKEKAHDVTFDKYTGDMAFLIDGAEEILIYNRQGELKQEIDVSEKDVHSNVNAILYHRDINEKRTNNTLYVGGIFFGKIGTNGQIEKILHSDYGSKDKIVLENGKDLYTALFGGPIYKMYPSLNNFIGFEHDNDESMRVIYHPSENKFYIGQTILQRGFKIEGDKAVETKLPGFVDGVIKELKEHKEKYGILPDN